VRERSKILDKCREIIQSRQNDNHIPEWVWTDVETDSWLNRNRDKLSMEKRYLLKQILKRLRKGYLKIAELNDIDLQKSKNQNQPLPELKKALLTQNAIDKCSRSIESIYQKVEWMKSANDPVALNFVHKKLIDELPKDMLGIYLSTLIYLKSKYPTLIEQVTEPFAEVDTGQPVMIARKFICPDVSDKQVSLSYDSTLKISFPPLPNRMRLPQSVLFLGVPPNPVGSSRSPRVTPPRINLWMKQLQAMGKVEFLSQKTTKQMVQQVNKDKARYKKSADVDMTSITPQVWVDAMVLTIHKRILELKSESESKSAQNNGNNTQSNNFGVSSSNSGKQSIFLYGWGVAANLIAQTIAKTEDDDLKHIEGVILLGMSNSNEEINIDNNLINLFRVPVFMVFGEKSNDFSEDNLEKLVGLVRERASEIRLENKKVCYHSLVVPCADNMLRMLPEDRINRFGLTKQAVDHATIDKIFEFCKAVLGEDSDENGEKMKVLQKPNKNNKNNDSGVKVAKKSFSTPGHCRISPSSSKNSLLSPPSSQKYKSVVSALTDLEYLEENENKQENKNKISFDLSTVPKKGVGIKSGISGISSIPMPHPSSDNVSPTSMPKPLITPSRSNKVMNWNGGDFITAIKRARLRSVGDKMGGAGGQKDEKSKKRTVLKL